MKSNSNDIEQHYKKMEIQIQEHIKQKEEILETIIAVQQEIQILQKLNKKVGVINFLSLVFLGIGLLFWIAEYGFNLLGKEFLTYSIFCYVISIGLSTYSLMTSKFVRKKLFKLNK